MLTSSVATYFTRVVVVTALLAAGTIGAHLIAGSAGPALARDAIQQAEAVADTARAQRDLAWEAMLKDLPEVSLRPPGDRSDLFPQGSSSHEAHPLLALADTRDDLRGLPLLRGAACQGPPIVVAAALNVRRGLSAADNVVKALGRGRSDDLPMGVGRTVAQAAQERPTLLWQICQCERDELRAVMTSVLPMFDGCDVTQTIARVAVFDSDAAIRREAVKALRARARHEARPALVAALSHPWPAAAERAADVLVALGDQGALPDLQRLVNGPDPGCPAPDESGTPAVRELVRVNHFRNCQLCHAPSYDAKDVARASVPSPDRPLPSSLAPEGYMMDPSMPAVRVDVTYLRPEFSRMQPVADPGRWTKHQRHDFIVRTRPATAAELAAARTGDSPQRAAALRAMHTLLGG